MRTHVDFETAKLLKEKGFGNPTLNWYDRRTKEFNMANLVFSVNRYTDNYSAPNIADVVMWLYKIHQIWISVLCDAGNDLLFTFKIYSIEIGNEKCLVNGNMYDTPTEAYEAAIEYTLKNLI